MIIQNTNNINDSRLRWPRKVEQRLETFVNNGGGLYVLHSGNNAFSHWVACDTMIGMGWRFKEGASILSIDYVQCRIPIQAKQKGRKYHYGTY